MTTKDPRGSPVDGTVVRVSESVERFCDVTLEDGTVLRAKLVVTEAIRLEGQWDRAGHPVYQVKSTNVIQVASSPLIRQTPLDSRKVQ